MALLVLKALIAAGNSFAQKVQKEQWCLYHLIFDLVCLESFCIQSSFRVTAVVQMSLEFRTQLCKVSLWIRKRGADVHLADVQCCPKCKNSKHVSIVLSPPSLSSLSSSLLISSLLVFMRLKCLCFEGLGVWWLTPVIPRFWWWFLGQMLKDCYKFHSRLVKPTEWDCLTKEKKIHGL